jgi:tRNA nucleotidyltransferase (CCA-adding enzyme)
MHTTVHTVLAELRGQCEVLYSSRLVQMVLYGSQARDDATPDSDIDVLVVLQGPVQPSEEIRRTGACSWTRSSSGMGKNHSCATCGAKGSPYD